MTELSKTLVLATGNPGKLKEMADLLQPLGVSLKAQSDFDTPEADETGLSFVENAIIKARNACKYSGLPSIADDSGIEVDALNGAPGIYSARFAGAGSKDADNNAKLIEELSKQADAPRTARYRCCMVFMRHENDPSPIITEGSLEGLIQDEAAGEGGFGYDPHFHLPQLGCTAAEISKEEKNRISHRGLAVRAMVECLGEVFSQG